MSTYKNLIGKDVNFLTTDPDNAQAEGQIWYNSTSGVFKDLITSSTWSSSASTNITRGSGYGFGTLTAGVTGTGEAGPPGLVPAATEEYNGSGWATGNNYPTQVFLSNGCGTQTAGIVAGGRTPSLIANANVYDGTNWTAAGGNLATAKSDGGMFGIQTSAIYCGGDNPTPGYIADTELYNGSSWSEVNNLPVAKRQFGTAGTSTAGLISGGRIGPGPSVATTEDWDGTNWTTGPNINTARRYLQGWGSSTSALIAGGSPNGSTASALTEMYDGTSWSETGDLATARHFSGTCQNQTSNTSGWLANGNAGPTFYNNTEEFDSSVNVITGAAWASGNAMNTTRRYMAGLGTRPAALAAGGSSSAPGLNETANSEEYNGTSWTEGNNLNTARVGLGGAGSQTSSIAAGGRTPGDKNATTSEEYNGTSWTATPSLSTGRRYVAGFGASETAAVVAGGTVGGAPGSGTNQTATEEYNGSSWTSGGAMNTAKTGTGGNSVGTETAGLYITGNAGVEEYNGSSWSEQNDLNRASPGNGGGACGSQTAALFAGGPSVSTETESYDGTSFITTASLGTGRNYSGGAGATSATGTIFGGFTGPTSPRTTGVTEEFTGETSALNIKTITTS
jgi:hypothetical protein